MSTLIHQKPPRGTPLSRSATTSHRVAPEPPELVAFADTFCPALILEDGSPVALYPEQRLMLAEYFGGIRESVILIPKKNGKTTLLAALALFHLVTTDDAACFIAAASRDQATILYDQAKGFVRRSDWLEDEVDVRAGYRQIRSSRDSGLIRVLAADADTADGVLPTLALVDELHRHKSADLYGIFRDGLGPRDGQMITISTAGDSEDSPLGKLRTASYEMDLQRDGVYRYARSSGFVMHEWACDATDDLENLDLVKQANPAPWQTVKSLRERHDSPSMTGGQWARFACGVWGLGSEPAFDPLVWALLGKSGQPDPGAMITLGFDGARRRDGTALVGCDIRTGHLFTLGYWQRPANADEDWEVPEDEVDQIVDHAFETWNVYRFYGDPPFWESALDRWAGIYGAAKVVRWWTNRIKATAIALRAFRNDMDPERMSHDGDEKLAEHIRNAVRQETKMMENDELLWVIRKDSRDSPRKIDFAMAAMLAWQARGDAIANGALVEPEYARAQWF